MEHPIITRINRYGDINQPLAISSCSSCNEKLYEGEGIVEWEDNHYCNTDCLVEFFLDNKDEFGVSETTLQEQ